MKIIALYDPLNVYGDTWELNMQIESSDVNQNDQLRALSIDFNFVSKYKSNPHAIAEYILNQNGLDIACFDISYLDEKKRLYTSSHDPFIGIDIFSLKINQLATPEFRVWLMDELAHYKPTHPNYSEAIAAVNVHTFLIQGTTLQYVIPESLEAFSWALVEYAKINPTDRLAVPLSMAINRKLDSLSFQEKYNL